MSEKWGRSTKNKQTNKQTNNNTHSNHLEIIFPTVVLLFVMRSTVWTSTKGYVWNYLENKIIQSNMKFIVNFLGHIGSTCFTVYGRKRGNDNENIIIRNRFSIPIACRTGRLKWAVLRIIQQ